MRALIQIIAIGMVVAIVAPAVSVAGDEGGAGLAVVAEIEPTATPGGGGTEAGYFCADSFSQTDCEFFCGDNASPAGGLQLVDCDWAFDLTCEDLTDKIGEPWEGSCTLDDQGPPPFGDLCLLISENLPNWTAEELCDFGKITGTWVEGGVCGAPVPAMPKAGQAALIVILMLGALVVLNLSGLLRSA